MKNSLRKTQRLASAKRNLSQIPVKLMKKTKSVFMEEAIVAYFPWFDTPMMTQDAVYFGLS